jgi:hypothetical protein
MTEPASIGISQADMSFWSDEMQSATARFCWNGGMVASQ